MNENMSTHDEPQRLYVIKLTDPRDPKKVLGYAMAEQIDYVADREDLLGAAKEALEAAKGAFGRSRQTLEAVALPKGPVAGVKMFALLGVGSSNNA